MTMTDHPTTTSTHGDCICGGSGMVPVDEDYVRRHAARMQQQGEDPVPGLLDALRDTVLPCYECRPTQYKLWADGHYRPGHTCATCRPKRKSTDRGHRRG